MIAINGSYSWTLSWLTSSESRVRCSATKKNLLYRNCIYFDRLSQNVYFVKDYHCTRYNGLVDPLKLTMMSL